MLTLELVKQVGIERVPKVVLILRVFKVLKLYLDKV